MMKKWLSQLLAVMMVLSVLLAVAACQPTTQPGNTAAPGDSSAPVDTSTPAETPTYTYNSVMGASPINWNPHAWQMDNEDWLRPYITAPFIDISIAPDGVNYEWVYEAATAITDITATFADKDAWGITETENRVYQIDLNPDVCWEDGTPINADSYIYSMQQLLDPAMKNYRANSYFVGDAALQNAQAYYNNDKAGQPMWADNSTDGTALVHEYSTWVLGADGQYTAADGTALRFALTAPSNYLGGDALGDYSQYFEESYAALEALADADGMVPVTDETIGLLKGFITSDDWGNEPESNLAYYAVYQNGVYEVTPWEKVGLLKTGEYQLTYILQDPTTWFYFAVASTSTWLVNEKLYEANKKTVESLVATDYCTSAETTMSFGPYKIVSFEVDKQFVLDRNENWYGYKDGKHEGQYMTDMVKVDIIGDHNTQLQLFNQGKLDEVDLTSDDMPTYRMSDYLLKTDETFTMRFIFATSLESLTSLEDEAGDGANKRILSYDDFRKAISFSIDRARFAAEATSAFKPAYFLLNNLYYYNIENDAESQYRNTTQAKEAVLRIYGIEYGAGKTYATVDEAYAAVTGYDVEAAKALFQSVYEKAIADGLYTDGQAINITCMCSAASSLTADDTRQQDLLNEFVTAATKGTGLEGKITFKFMSGSSSRYDDVASGKVEMIRGAWGGAAFYPFSTIRVYCEPDYMGGLAKIHESNGWDPTKEKLTITYDFNHDGTAETVEQTFQYWAKSINDGTYADPEDKLAILSWLESGIVMAGQCIPVATYTTGSLFSKQIQFATLTYNIMYDYGGIRLMTYNYSDAEWDKYVADQGGTLNYE
ncbi:MAG: ABC transporter substrate-binding protein [Clostridiaceae bacterium]|nr:ABC transporter substrate-binding protein [Eubacteriales bacterium]